MANDYSPAEYWKGVASGYGATDEDALAPVLHPGAPAWFNLTIDRLQHKAWLNAVRACGLAQDAKALDVGCGTGRWLRRYTRAGYHAIGIDPTQDMLRRVNEMGTTTPLVAALAQRLPFQNDSFDLVSAVTVVQHVAPSDQAAILREMSRVLRPGGSLLLIELIRGVAPHIFPRRMGDWIALGQDAGLRLIHQEGQEFLLFDRAFVGMIQSVRRAGGRPVNCSLPAQSPGQSPDSLGRRAYWWARRVTCKLSTWVEPAAKLICPDRWATHGVFVFRK